MIFLDSSFLVDYLDGRAHTADFLEANRGRPFVASHLVFFELYRGGAHAGGPSAIDRIASSLEWVRLLETTDEHAREAALIEAELLELGQPINLGDVLIAGACRASGGALATCDGDFERVPELDVTVVSRDDAES